MSEFDDHMCEYKNESACEEELDEAGVDPEEQTEE